MLREYVTAEGFDVLTAKNGQHALYAARQEKPDCIILDLMMPEMSGQEFIRIYTAESDTPILVLTAKVDEMDKVLGLELGADDYVTKPLSLREISARVKALLRRAQKQKGSEFRSRVLSVSDIKMDLEAHLVEVREELIDLTPSEYKLLETLMSSPGRAFSRQDLLESFGETNWVEGLERTVDVHVHNLREKIELDPSQPKYIETVYGMGYRFKRE
jgi:DNA-binding response OmpR family regulator